jgi:WD40 repeat protein
VSSKIKLNMLGYNICVSDDDTCMVLSDPQNDEISVYIRNNVGDEWVRLQTLNNRFSENERTGVNHSSMVLTADGERLLVASTTDKKVSVFAWRYSRFELDQEIVLPSVHELVLSPDGAALGVVLDPTVGGVQLYHWSSEQVRYVIGHQIPVSPQVEQAPPHRFVLCPLESTLSLCVTVPSFNERPGEFQVWQKV